MVVSLFIKISPFLKFYLSIEISFESETIFLTNILGPDELNNIKPGVGVSSR